MATLRFRRHSATVLAVAAAFAAAVAYAQSDVQGSSPEREGFVAACERASSIIELKGVSCNDAKPIPLHKKLSEIETALKASGHTVEGELYKDFTPMRRLRVATAAFVEPELVGRTKVVYFYPAKREDLQRLAAALKEGGVKLAYRGADDNYFVFGGASPGGQDPLALLMNAHDKGAADRIGIVSEKSQLLGVKPANKIVSWFTPFVLNASESSPDQPDQPK